MDAPHSPEVGEQLPVQVLLRLRPLVGQRETIVVHAGPRSIKICNPVQSTSASGESVLVSKRLEYSFDWVLPEASSQQDTFRKSCPSMLRHFLSGGNALLFCYGPSGSGKTYTILGDDKNPGVLPNLLKTIYASIETANASNSNAPAPSSKDNAQTSVYPLLPGMEYNVWISYLECYNERVYDLLKKKERSAKDAHPVALDIKYTKNHVPIIPSNEPLVEQYQQAMQWLHIGNNNRQTGSTQINNNSSRSHTIFTIKLTQTPIGATEEDIKADPSIVRYSKFSIVDLAGSERSNKSQATGDRLREASNINNSLLTLKRCMKALQQNQMLVQTAANVVSTASGLDSAQKPVPTTRRISVDKGLGSTIMPTMKQPEVVPFRDSILTKLLREYLQGEGKCSVIVNIHPAPADYEESLAALDFGTITKAVKTTTCKKKLVARSASPPQPIPFSLTQSNAAGKNGPTSSNALQSNKKPSALNLLERLQMQQQQTSTLSLSSSAIGPNHASGSSVAPSLNTSLNTSTVLNRSTASSIAPVEANSPSKSALDRSRSLHHTSTTNSPSQKRLQLNSSPFEDNVAGVAMQLFKPLGETENRTTFTEVSEEYGEEESEEFMEFDEMELITEVNRLRVALADAETRIIEAEMAVRSELAQDMADRISEMDTFYRNQSDTRVRLTQEKYEKLLQHYQQALVEEQESVAQEIAESEAEAQANAFNLLVEKEAALDESKAALELAKQELTTTTAKLHALQELAHKQLQEAQEKHREEVAILNLKLEAMVAKEKELTSASATAVSVANVGPVAEIPALDTGKKKNRGKKVEVVAVEECVSASTEEVLLESATENSRASVVSSSSILLASEDVQESGVDAELDAKRTTAASKKRRGKAEVVPGRSKVSKVQEDTTPATTRDKEIATDLFEFPDATAEEEEQKEEKSTKATKRKSATRAATAGRGKRGTKKAKDSSMDVVIDLEEEYEDVPVATVDKVEKPGPKGRKAAAVTKEIAEETVESEVIEVEVISTPTKVPAALATTKLSLRGRKLASPSSPHLIAHSASPVSQVSRGTKKGKLVGKVVGIDVDSDFENQPDDQNVEPLPSRTPLTKRLRSRRPADVLADSPMDDFKAPASKRTTANPNSISSQQSSRRRGAAAAPRYLGGFM